ncbi:MAG: VOC family protein [Flavobacteriia bacterium]|nr:VOC family protein [Flavobacteriia bacterium]
MAHLPAWIEIPVTDIDRAEEFYGKVLNVEFNRLDLANGLILSTFPVGPDEIGGALACLPAFYHPGETGPMVYLAVDSVTDCLERVEHIGGTVIVPTTQVSEQIGFMGVMRDSEGNRIGLMGGE